MLRRQAIGLGATLAVAAAFAAPAGAHPSLIQVVPAGGAVAPKPPRTIELSMTERLVLRASSITVRDRGGREVALGPVRRPRNADGLAADVEGRLASGIYTIKWTALGDDGHTVGGDVKFGVAGPGGEPPPGAEQLAASGSGIGTDDSGIEGPLAVAVRWAGLVASFFLLGGAVLVLRLARRADLVGRRSFEERWERLSRLALALLILTALETVIDSAAAPATGSGFDLGLLFDSSTGGLALLRLAVAVVAPAALIAARGPARTVVLGGAGAVALVTEAVNGHTSALIDDRAIASVQQSIHLLAGGVWVGGVLAIVLCVAVGVSGGERTPALRTATRAFAPIAGGTAVLVIVTGVLAAIREVDAWYFLSWSAYGRVLIAKLALVALLLTLGALVFLLLRRKEPAAAANPSSGGRARRLLTVEAGAGAAVLLLAATLAGLVQGKGQPLPAQRGNLLPGPGFANAGIRGGVAQLTLAPARSGANRVSVVLAPSPGEESSGAPRARSVEVRLACPCAERPIDLGLERDPAGVWVADTELPADGAWTASVEVDGRRSTTATSLLVGVDTARGSRPITIASVTDLSGPDAARCRSEQVGLRLAVGTLNAGGGADGGRKVAPVVLDDRGQPARARRLVKRIEDDFDPALFVAPCGGGAAATIEAIGDRVPTLVSDPRAPVVEGSRVFRLAADPRAEGFGAGQYIATNAFRIAPDAPRRVSALIGAGEDTAQRVAGLRAALRSVDTRVDVLRPDQVDQRSLRSAVDAGRYAGAFLDAPQESLDRELAELGETSFRSLRPTAMIAPSGLFNEAFIVDGGSFARTGSITLVGNYDPQSSDALGYTSLVPFFPGERPTIPGLSGYVAGKAVAYALRAGTDADSISDRLRRPSQFSQALAGPWSQERPWAGGILFKMFRPSFLPTGLVPQSISGLGTSSGRFFEEGAWRPLGPELYGPVRVPAQQPAAGERGP